MQELYKLENAWYIKIIFAAITTLFAPFKIALLVLCTMIIIDTLTGCIYAAKTKRLNSRGLRRGLNKIVVYSICILIVRLLEIGVQSIFSTTLLTEFITGYLILTESLSALENLNCLGAPLPLRIKKIILANIKNDTLRQIVIDDENKKDYNDEISDIKQYCLPNINDEKIKTVMLMMINEWTKFINILDKELDEAEGYSNDLILCKVLSLLEATKKTIRDIWIDQGIPKNYMERFMIYHRPRLDKYLTELEVICESSDSIEMKKKQITEKLIILMYLTVADGQKSISEEQ
ncbi:phage holin family protein [Clostridium sp. YIM B02505]|uniref:Phage holin family protein n=1 Tax=Clostridium yunnanense TaxID=2800325 RepID=A0ABS1ELN1_9CLOT|nr:phage holin family protein [Clostridium yunnanense]MBK1810250.1 phage holin family protein [Clostridium yunnanense]